MTQAFLNSVRKYNFYNFKSKFISQNESMGEYLKKFTVDDFGSIPEPSCLDFDDELSLLVIGNKKGIIRVFGKPGVSFIGRLENQDEIWNVKFIPGTSYLVSLTSENKLTLWLILPSSKDLLKIDTITNLTNPTGHVNIQQLIHSDLNNNCDTASSLNITAIEFINITSSIILGNGEGSLIQVKVDLMKMSKQSEVINANQRPLSTSTPWQHPTEADVITKERIIKKLPSGSQNRVQLDAIIHISSRPGSRKQLLIGYNTGHSVVYDLQQDSVVYLLSSPAILNNLCWCPPDPIVQDCLLISSDNCKPQYQLSNKVVSCHEDGSITRWTLPTNNDAFLAMNSEPIFPYGGMKKCLAVSNIKWKKHARGDLIIFAGGLSRAEYMTKSTITVMFMEDLETNSYAKEVDSSTKEVNSRHVVFDLTSKLIDFKTIEDQETNYTQFLMVLTEEEFFVVDLNNEGWPAMYNQQPYLKCLHHTPITAYHFLTNVSPLWFNKLKEIDPEFPNNAHNPDFSTWPIKGDLQCVKRDNANIDLWQNDLLITGHGDGTVLFWRLGLGGCLQQVSSVKSNYFFKNQESGYFEYNDDEDIPFRKAGVFDPCCDDNRLAVQMIYYTGRNLLIGGCGGQVILWGFVDESYKRQIVEIDLTTHLPNFQWKGCQPLELTEVKNRKTQNGFNVMMTLLVFPPSQITALDIFDDNTYNNQLLIGFGTLHGLAVVSCSKTVYVEAYVLTTHCTIPKGGEASQEAALGEGWARRRTRELKKSLRNSFRKLRRKSTRRMEHPAVKRNLSTNPNNDELKVEFVANETDFEERVVEDRPKDVANNGLVRSIKISISSSTKKSTVPGGERYLNLFAGSSGGLLLWFQSDTRIENSESNKFLKLRLLKEYQLQHSAPILFLNLISQDHNKQILNKAGGNEDDRLDQLIVITEEQVRLYCLPGLGLKYKLRVTANEGYRMKNAHMVILQDERSGPNALSRESFISVVNNGGQLMMLSSSNLKRKDVVQFVDKTDLMALNFMSMATSCENELKSLANKAVTPYGIHYSGHGQVTLFEIVPKSKSCGFISKGYIKR